MLAFSDSRFRLLGRLLTAILAMITFSAVLAMPAGAEDPPGDGQPADPQPGEGQTADQQPAEGIPSEPVDTPVQPEPEPTTAVDQLVFPIVGPVTYSDTWGACRGYRCYRSHKGVDIFGTKLAPLVAVTDGIIISTRRTALTSAGNKVIIEDDDGWRYIYLHLNNDSPGTDDGANPQGWIIPNRLRIGDRVEAGDIIGYLGDSGNAERTPAHLHFEVHEPGIGAVNPTPYVRAAQDAGRVIATSTLASSADGRAEYVPLVSAWYRALLKRQPTDAELFAWTDRFDIGFADRSDLIADLTMAPVRRHQAGTVLRAYLVALGRRPDLAEIRAGIGLVASGYDAEAMVAELLAGPRFAERHGSLSDEAYLELIYVNARGRQPSTRVRAYWLKQLAGGRDRASMAAYFVGSYTLKSQTWHSLEVIQAYRAALDRLPTDSELDEWVSHLNRGGEIVDIVAAVDS
ncbi:MAG: DUF4214 domain-containing protein [Actinomycetia bacterium]|nr:DUF4214 domain-containing protein [Actinomycetes bacterium]